MLLKPHHHNSWPEPLEHANVVSCLTTLGTFYSGHVMPSPKRLLPRMSLLFHRRFLVRQLVLIGPCKRNGINLLTACYSGHNSWISLCSATSDNDMVSETRLLMLTLIATLPSHNAKPQLGLPRINGPDDTLLATPQTPSSIAHPTLA